MNTKRITLGGLLAGSIVVIGELARQAIFTPAAPASGGSMPLGVLILRGVSLGGVDGLGGDAQDSPIVRRREQYWGITGLAYQF